jgi:hypothetical protein
VLAWASVPLVDADGALLHVSACACVRGAVTRVQPDVALPVVDGAPPANYLSAEARAQVCVSAQMCAQMCARACSPRAHCSTSTSSRRRPC